MLGFQPRLRLGDRIGLLDDLLPPAFVVAALVDPRDVLSAGQLARLDTLGVVVLHLTPEVDVDQVLLSHLADAGHVGFVGRPDHYLFATAETPSDLVDAVADLLSQLPAPVALAEQR